jgi:hydroxymethylbilane synthase
MLAQTQTKLFRRMLLEAWPGLTVNIELIDTQGDMNRHDPLPAIGGKGLFTLELENALRDGRIDLAVHSLKDLPVEDSPELAVVAIPSRAAVQDMLISRQTSTIEKLPAKAVVGTSSLRRASQILAVRPDIQIKDIRGNVDTRLHKLDDQAHGYDAIMLAQAGLDRLNYTLEHAHPIPLEQMLPAPGQGALGIQGRADDAEVNQYLQSLDDMSTRVAVTAERAFLAGLGGGCSLPVGALGLVDGDILRLQALVASPDGQQIIRVNGESNINQAHSLGDKLAQEALANGAQMVLQQVA